MSLYDNISYPQNTAIEDNINFFINWFHFNLINAGHSHFFEIETHLSLAKKIEFQLNTNLDNSPNFILKYLKNQLFNSSDPLFYKYDLCIDLLDAITDIQNETYTKGKQIRIIVEGTCFQNEINDLVSELETDYVNDLMDGLLDLISDENLIANRLEELRYFSNLIISHFLLKGYSYSDLDDLFHYQTTRLPKKKPPTGNFEIEIDSITEIIDLFRFLENSFEKEFDFYVPIKGIDFEKIQKFKYNEVIFFHVSDTEISAVLKKTKNNYSNWLIDISEDKVFCKTTITGLTLDSAKERAYSLFKSELIYLNISLNTEGRLNGEFFIGTEDGEGFMNFFKNKSNEIGTHNIQSFKNNPFEFYRGTTTDAKERVKRFEPYFISAISESSVDREISSLWHYLEVLFYHWRKQSELKSLFSFLLLLDENNNCLKQLINDFVIESIKQERNWALGLDWETQERFKLCATINIELFRTEMQNPFFQVLINEYEKFNLQDNLKKSQDYYLRIVDEVYSVRNSFLHSGEVNKYSITKLKFVFPALISRVRNLLHSEIETDVVFEDIVENLYTTSKALI